VSLLLRIACSPLGWRDVPKLDDEDSPASAVFRHLEEIDKPGEAGLSRQLRCDFGEGDLEHLRDEDFTGRERVSATDLDVRPLPEADRGGDLSASDSVAQGLDELHLVVAL
jgi:hypothetical protein